MSRSKSSSSGSKDMSGSSSNKCKLSVSSSGILVLEDPRTEITDTGCILTPVLREGRLLGCSLIGFCELVVGPPPIRGELSLMVEVEMLVRGTDTVDICGLAEVEPVSRFRIGS